MEWSSKSRLNRQYNHCRAMASTLSLDMEMQVQIRHFLSSLSKKASWTVLRINWEPHSEILQDSMQQSAVDEPFSPSQQFRALVKVVILFFLYISTFKTDSLAITMHSIIQRCTPSEKGLEGLLEIQSGFFFKLPCCHSFLHRIMMACL